MAELRYAVRSLRKSSGFTLVAVLTLALGVGANTAIFSLVNAVLLRPLPYADPGRLVLVWESAPFFGLHDSPVAPANYFDWRERSRSFSEMGAIESLSYRLVGSGRPEVLQGSLVTASALRALGIRPMLGRVFRDEEDRPGAAKVAILSYGLWQRRLGGDPNVLGRTLTLNDEKHTIVGVLAPGTEVPTEYGDSVEELWTPLESAYSREELAARGRHNWMVVGRLRPGVTLAQADREMAAIGKSLAREYPETNREVGAFVAPLREHFVGSSRRVLLILLGAVGFVLLIACSNLANLLLSRTAARTKEIAVRAALGAGAFDLLRRFLWESLLLAAAGSGLGVLLAVSTFRFLAHLAPGTVTGMNELAVDWRVLAYTLAIALSTAVAFGLVPLLEFRRAEISHALKQGSRTLAAGAGSRRVRALLISSEVALAFMLLIGAGLLLRTLAALRAVNVGFDTRNLLTLRMPPPEKYHGPEQSIAYQDEVLRRVSAIPGVVSAGFTNHVPVAVKGDISGLSAEGHDASERFQAKARTASAGYLQTLRLPLRRGRYIDERDRNGAPRAVVINETLARTLWPGRDPIGRYLVFRDSIRVPVVGVVGDIRHALDAPPQPEFYISAAQAGFPQSSLAIRTRVEPESVAKAVRQAIWAVDPDQPITDVATMDEILDREMFQRRLQTTLLGAFAGLALLLAAVGLYGVLAYVVGRQTPEIGLRLALGAAPADILRGVLGRGLRLAAAGLAAGLAGALALSRVLSSLVSGVPTTDPATYAAVAALLVATAIVASYVPARRAMRVDPMAALREE